MIPARILVTYISRSAMNPLMRHCVRRMEELHPEWEVSFFSDGDCREFVRQQGSGMLDLYDWYPRPVQKVDFFRILAVNALGGFYLDADVLLSSALDPLRKHKAVFPWEHQLNWEEYKRRFPARTRNGIRNLMVGNYAFGAEAGHPFLTRVFEELVERTTAFEPDRCSDLDILHSTGADAVTSCYYQDRVRWGNLTLLHGAADTSAGELPLHGGQRWHRFGCYGRHLLNNEWRTATVH